MSELSVSRSGAKNIAAHWPRSNSRRAARALERDERLARRGEDFERAKKALPVARTQPGGGRRIADGKLCMQRRGLERFGFLAHTGPHPFGTAGISESLA